MTALIALIFYSSQQRLTRQVNMNSALMTSDLCTMHVALIDRPLTEADLPWTLEPEPF